MHQAIAVELGAGDDLPCADAAFVVPLKRSREFRALRTRLAGRPPHPVYDSWLDDGFHFFVFALDGAGDAGGLAVFAMHPEVEGPASAITVVPTGRDRYVQITDVRGLAESYMLPLPPDPRPA